MIFWTPTPKSDLFDHLVPYRFILVTGPQRAGTTIAAAMIANDLGYEYGQDGLVWGMLGIKPPEPPGSRDWHYYFNEIRKDPIVIHCSEHCAYVHQYVDVDGLAVVMVRRAIEDIIASQKRVGWGFEWLEMKHYPGKQGPISRAKYEFWDQKQKPILGDRAFEIEYECLSKHPLWVPKEQRKNFHICQIEVGKPRGERIQNPKLTNEANSNQ